MSKNRTKEELEELKGGDVLFISELATLTDTRFSTLKFYVEQKLLPFEQEGGRLRRRFIKKDVLQRLREIKKLRDEGKSIDLIKAHFGV